MLSIYFTELFNVEIFKYPIKILSFLGIFLMKKRIEVKEIITINILF